MGGTSDLRPAWFHCWGSPLKPFLPALLAVVLCATSSTPAFSQRQQAIGPGNIPLNVAGSLNGVDMIGSLGTGTLVVGVVGGPKTDIFTSNAANFALQAVSSDASSSSNIRFNSGSTVFGAVGLSQGPFFLDVFAGNAAADVNFQGGVFATRVHVTGTGAVNFNSGTVNRTALIFDADGTISLAPNTTVIGALTSTAGANTGILALANASVLDGAVGGATGLKSINVIGGSATTGGTARITGAVDAFAFSLGTNTLLVDGALTIANQGPAGVINTTLASTSVFGNIRPKGATNLGPTLQLNVTVPATSFFPVGTVFNIVQTQTGTPQSGTNGTVLGITVKDPTNPLYRFSAVPPAGTVNGLVAIRTDAIPLLVPVAPPAGTPLPGTLPVAAVIAPILLGANLTPDLQFNVLPAINALSDAASVVNAVAQLAPRSPDLAGPLVAFQGARQLQDLWMSHLDDASAGSTGPTTNTTGTDRWWAKGSGYFGQQDQVGGFSGYDSRILETMAGYERRVGRGTRAGVGAGFGRTHIDGRDLDLGSNTDSDNYAATLYLAHDCGPWFLYGDLGYGSSDYSGTRRISFPGLERRATSRYRGDEFTAFAATGYRLRTRGGTLITPLASLQYTPVSLDGYTEFGAGDISLVVNSQRYNFLESGLGVKASRTCAHRDDTYIPELHGRWLHELSNPTLDRTAAFNFAGATAFTTPGLKPADDTFDVGAGVTFLPPQDGPRTWSLQAVYDYNWRSDSYRAHEELVKLTGRF